MSQTSIESSRAFFLWDEPRTLFPMALSRIMVDTASTQLHDYVQNNILDSAKREYSFLPQLRVHAAKARHHTRRTVKLDPVAEYFIYDFSYRNRALFRKPFQNHRRHFGYRFEEGTPLGGIEAYSQFKMALAIQGILNNYSLGFDIASYFNSIYHHDLVNWFSAQGGTPSDSKALGQFLREINAGRSIDCLPHGLYPCKMIGNSFLSFVDTSNRIQCAQLVRFMDDFYLFDDNPQILIDDFHQIQVLIGERGLSVNAEKTRLPSEANPDPSDGLNNIKIGLLKKRRQLMLRYDIDEDEEIAKHPDLKLTEAQVAYLRELVTSDDLTEENAELVLALMQEYTDDIMEHLTLLAAAFPNLAKRFHQFCQKIDDKELLADVLLSLLEGPHSLTEFQLFWFAKILEDHLLATSKAGVLLGKLFEHKRATLLSRARVLEIPENRFGMADIREMHLRTGSSDWLAWAAAAGARMQKKMHRNYILTYFANASPLNHLVADCICALP